MHTSALMSCKTFVIYYIQQKQYQTKTIISVSYLIQMDCERQLDYSIHLGIQSTMDAVCSKL